MVLIRIIKEKHGLVIKRILLAAILATPSFLLAEDKVVFKDYHAEEGKIIRVTDEHIILEKKEEKKIEIERKKVAKIIYEDGSIMTLYTHNEDEKKVVHEHTGFFFRYQFGLGYASVNPKASALSGNEFDDVYDNSSLQIGGTIVENLPVYFNISSIQAMSISVYGVMAGVGLSYYFMPSNYYIDFSVGYSFIQIEMKNPKTGETQLFESGMGAGAKLALGKE